MTPAEKLQKYEGCLHTFKNYIKEKWQERQPEKVIYQDFSHIYRRKTRTELIRLSAAVMGIEFSYSAETAFVSPTLLKIGVQHKNMTLVWALSPLFGFFLTPILGSLSDRCPLNMGRRRPFILLMSVGVFFGLLLVPNGEILGSWAGDSPGQHSWGIFFTVLGTILLDFDADACQSPARAYLLDVTVSEDHARGLSTFTIMAGLGGFLGYALGGINWDITPIGKIFGGHVRAVFSLTTLIFIICVSYTITSFKEMPLSLFEIHENLELQNQSEYVSLDEEDEHRRRPSANASLFTYLKSIFLMPKSLKILCLTNLFCWMAHVCYSLYFTDFVGEAVFGGNPTELEGTPFRELYESGVRFGCWGMSMYSLSCACYSMIIERFILNYGAKKVYISGLLVYSMGMFLMALTKHKVGVILFSWTAGVMYSTLFTMPYLLVAHYHAKGTFGNEIEENNQIRGLGTDVAIVSSMVFLAQFILSVCMGQIVNYIGSTTAVVSVASFLAFCGAISATQVIYLDL